MITCTFENGNQNNLRHATVDCLVIKDGEILLEHRNSNIPGGGLWSLVGGYMERDETTQECGAREALEETGWRIGNFMLLRLNDNPARRGEDRQNVSFVYVTEALEKVGEGDWESDELKWFPLDAVPPKDQIAFDHADNIELYKRHLESPLPLPIMGRPVEWPVEV